MAPGATNASLNESDKHKSLDQEVRELISALTGRLGSIQRSQKPGSSTSADDDDQGVRIITLAGTNLGATMRGDMDEKATGPQGLAQPEQEDSASYVVNSNFQAINNSIMLGGSYKTNDPGVHLDVTDYVDHNEALKNPKKGKKSKRGSHKGEHHGARSDEDSDHEKS